jgi:hypothetical protein
MKTSLGSSPLFAVMLAVLLLSFFQSSVRADAARDEMQKSLNAEVMNSPFDPGDVAKAKAYAEEAVKKAIPPTAVAPTYWQPGWTCSDLTSYRYYRYYDYRNCIYYHRYYGRYW